MSKSKKFNLRMKAFFLFIIISLALALCACESGIEDTLQSTKTWQTQADADDSCIRLEFSGKNVKYVNVIEGEDIFSQSFTYELENSTLIFTGEYATLTFDVTLSGNTLTLKSESGENLVFTPAQ